MSVEVCAILHNKVTHIVMPIRVAFQGVHGANSELAIRQHFGTETVETVPCPLIGDAFAAIQSHQVDLALIPVENAMAGAVSQAYELLMESDLLIQAEVVLHVHHALLAPKGTALSDIKQARSHPQALAQCEQFLRRHQIEPIPTYDTAGAARDLATTPAPGVAAIASRLAGELYGLDALMTDIEDVQFNFTRFLLLGHDSPTPSDYNKTSLVFATRHRPAALYECLGEFANRGLNLTKIESRPRRNKPWEPLFYLDFEGHWQDPNCQAALAQLLLKASFVKLLGSYPAVKKSSVGI
jgi:prephenate dehydratase